MSQKHGVGGNNEILILDGGKDKLICGPKLEKDRNSHKQKQTWRSLILINLY